MEGTRECGAKFFLGWQVLSPQPSSPDRANKLWPHEQSCREVVD
jgi:hypothetical protein